MGREKLLERDRLACDGLTDQVLCLVHWFSCYQTEVLLPKTKEQLCLDCVSWQHEDQQLGEPISGLIGWGICEVQILIPYFVVNILQNFKKEPACWPFLGLTEESISDQLLTSKTAPCIARTLKNCRGFSRSIAYRAAVAMYLSRQGNLVWFNVCKSLKITKRVVRTKKYQYKCSLRLIILTSVIIRKTTVCRDLDSWQTEDDRWRRPNASQIVFTILQTYLVLKYWNRNSWLCRNNQRSLSVYLYRIILLAP